MRITLGGFLAVMLIFSIIGGISLGTTVWFLDRTFDSDSFIQTSKEDIISQVSKVNATEVFTDVSEIAKEVGPSIVSITTKTVSDSFFGQVEGEMSGSGIIYKIFEDTVYILTNYHVIEDFSEILVDFDDGKLVKTELSGFDEDMDLAVIKIEEKIIGSEKFSNLRAANFGNSTKLNVGEPAIAIGNPLGYNDTVTTGVISSIKREISLSRFNVDLIQTDAAINPGNSGGALLNAIGEVIGINTMKINDTAVEGIGFAIPISTAIPIADELIEKGYVSRAYLGVSGKTVDEESSKAYNIPVGVYIANVADLSPADKAGLLKEDVIINYANEKIEDTQTLISLIIGTKIGENVEIKVIRDNEELVFNVILEERPKE
jgi:serine protease Do